jgi:hypothetical protein
MSERLRHRADEFETRIRAAEIGPATEVVLILYYVDQQGRELEPIRVSLEPSVTAPVLGSGDRSPEEQATYERAVQQFAKANLIAGIIGNMRNMIATISDEPVTTPTWPSPVLVRDVSLEINQP